MRTCLALHGVLCLLGLIAAGAGCSNTRSGPKVTVPSGVPGMATTQSGSNEGKSGADAGSTGDSLADGEECASDAECDSNHCRHGVCCAGGECCRTEQDCGDGGGTARTCDRPDECQGTRSKYVCTDFRCRTRDPQEDDRACTDEVQASPCGPYRAVYCDGEREQRAPECPEACGTDSDCDDTAQCTDGACVDRRAPTGGSCTNDGDCTSGVCSDGRCCQDRVACQEGPGAPQGSEEDQLRCLDVFTPGVTSDACRACACERCAPAMLDCWASGDPTRDNLCRSVTGCVYFASCAGDCSDETYGCYGELCFCGAGNQNCDYPYGPCVEQIAAAGGTWDPALLRERSQVGDNPLRFAHQYSECMVSQCRSACAF